MTPAITPADQADLPAIVDVLAANKLPRAGIERHLATTLVAREDPDLVMARSLP